MNNRDMPLSMTNEAPSQTDELYGLLSYQSAEVILPLLEDEISGEAHYAVHEFPTRLESHTDVADDPDKLFVTRWDIFPTSYRQDGL